MTDLFTIRVRYQNAAIIATSDVATTGVTDWICLTGQVVVQITGTATAISVRVERSSLCPDSESGPNPAPADGPGIEISGNASTGIAPVVYVEPAVGWWRLVVTSIAGSANLSISGFYGGSNATLPGETLVCH